MNSETIFTIAGFILGSAGLFSLIQFLINRHDRKKDELKELKKDVLQATDELKEDISKCIKNQRKLELDTTRLQMLVLMTHFPEETQRLMQLAERYFVRLEGDWYMSSMFSGYCKKHDIPLPEWFRED